MGTFNSKFEIAEILVLVILLLTYVVGVSVYGLFVEGALWEVDPDEPTVSFFDKTTFYWALGVPSFLIVICIAVMKIVVGKNKKLLDKFGWASVEYIHDPEEAPISKISKTVGRFIASPVNAIFIGIVVFAGLGLFGAIKQTFFFAPIPTEFQASPVAKMIFAVEPASTMETMLFFALMLVQDGILYWILTRRAKTSMDTYKNISMFLIPVIIGVEWMGFHLLRYGGSDVALQITFFFGFFGALMTKFFGTIIFWEIWHIMNNLFFKASRLFDSDVILGITIAIVIVFAIIYVAILGLKSSRNQVRTLT